MEAADGTVVSENEAVVKIRKCTVRLSLERDTSRGGAGFGGGPGEAGKSRSIPGQFGPGCGDGEVGGGDGSVDTRSRREERSRGRGVQEQDEGVANGDGRAGSEGGMAGAELPNVAFEERAGEVKGAADGAEERAVAGGDSAVHPDHGGSSGGVERGVSEAGEIEAENSWPDS